MRDEFVKKYKIVNGKKIYESEERKPKRNEQQTTNRNKQQTKNIYKISVTEKPKTQIKRPNPHKKAKYKGNMRKKILALAVAGVVIIGGISTVSAIYNDSKQNEPATIEQVLKNGESLEDLKINDNILSDIEQIKKILDRDDLQNTELMRISR